MDWSQSRWFQIIQMYSSSKPQIFVIQATKLVQKEAKNNINNTTKLINHY